MHFGMNQKNGKINLLSVQKKVFFKLLHFINQG